MSEQSSHIISRFRWETSFDQKGKATELQQRLSSWGRLNLKREIAAVFDTLCLPGQTVRIRRLEIDLGCLDFDQLESKLSIAFGKQLKDALTALLLHSDAVDNLEIQNEGVSQLEVLQHFLRSGVLPWYANGAAKSVNTLMAEALKKNKRETAEMLRMTAPAHENVRKRMAWQLHEANIMGIISVIEPTNDEQIFRFSDAMSQVQQRQNIVQDNSSDFRKNLWLWILNYLFIDRGSFFNKAAFMKSSIRQMANHYNVALVSLLELIEQALAQTAVKAGAKSEFIKMLHWLAGENDNPKELKGATQQTHPESALRSYLRQAPKNIDATKKTEINEWIIALDKADRTVLAAIIAKAEKANRCSLIKHLHPIAFLAILRSLSPDASDALLGCIDFVYRIAKQARLTISYDHLREMAVAFAIRKNSSPFQKVAFLAYIIEEMARRRKATPESIVNDLLVAEIPSADKNSTNAEIYTALTVLFEKQNRLRTNADFNAHLHDLLQQLYQEVMGRRQRRIRELSALIKKYLTLNPTQTFLALATFTDPARLQQLIPYFIDERSADTLVRNANSAHAVLLVRVKEIADQFNDPILNRNFHDFFGFGLKVTLQQPDCDAATFLKVILQMLQQRMGHAWPALNSFLDAVLDPKNLKGATAQSQLLKIRAQLAVHTESKKTNRSQTKPLPTSKINSHRIIDTKGSGVVIDTETLCAWIEKAMRNGAVSLTQNGKTYTFSEMIRLALNDCPTAFRKLLCRISITEKRIAQLQKACDWNECCQWIAADSADLQRGLETLRSLYHFSAHFTSGNSAEVQKTYWKQLWQAIAAKSASNATIKKMVRERLDQLFQTESLDSSAVLAAIQTHKLWVAPLLKESLLDYHTAFASIVTGKMQSVASTAQYTTIELESLFDYMMRNRRLPSWFINTEKMNVQEVFCDLTARHPVAFIRVWRQNAFRWQKPAPGYWMDFNQWAQIIIRYQGGSQSMLTDLVHLHTALGRLSMRGMAASELQEILLHKLIADWTSDALRNNTLENYWDELLWEVDCRGSISKAGFHEALAKIKYGFPISVRLAYESRVNPNTQRNKASSSSIQLATKPLNLKNPGGIPVKNAGLVLLNNYLPMLLERLGIVREQQFFSVPEQCEAVHYLQYTATGLTHTEETLLPLNKVLCGLSLSTPIKDSLRISKAHKDLVNGLINASISHWPTIGHTSIDGFRGNWLVRDGLLLEKEDRWELSVEKRAYDVLIHKSPFSFSIIKYPWMGKPLHVIWPY